MNIGAVSGNYNVGQMNAAQANKSYQSAGIKSQALQADTVCFKGKAEGAEAPKKKSSVVHKALVAATNCFCPGMGQAINGQWGKAAMFLVGAPLAVFAAMTVSLPLAMAVGAAAEIGMFVDAYRNA